MEMAFDQGHRSYGNRNAPRSLLLLQHSVMLSILLLFHIHPSYTSPVESASPRTASVGALRTSRAATDGGVGDIVGVGNGTHIFRGGPFSDSVLGFGEVDGLVGPGGLEELDPFQLTDRTGEVFPPAASEGESASGGGRIPDSLGPGQRGGLVEVNTKAPRTAGGDGFDSTILGQVFDDPLTQVIKNDGVARGKLSAGEDPLLFGQVDPEGKDEVPLGGIPGPASSPSISTGGSLGMAAFASSGGKSPFRSARAFNPIIGASGFDSPPFFRHTESAVPASETSVARMGKAKEADGSRVRLIGGAGPREGSVQTEPVSQ